MDGSHFILVESALYSWEVSRLGDVRELDGVLMNAMWTIARLADDLALVQGSDSVRCLPWEPVLKEDGTLVRLVIYFTIVQGDTVDLLSIREQPL